MIRGILNSVDVKTRQMLIPGEPPLGFNPSFDCDADDDARDSSMRISSISSSTSVEPRNLCNAALGTNWNVTFNVWTVKEGNNKMKSGAGRLEGRFWFDSSIEIWLISWKEWRGGGDVHNVRIISQDRESGGMCVQLCHRVWFVFNCVQWKEERIADPFYGHFIVTK